MKAQTLNDRRGRPIKHTPSPCEACEEWDEIDSCGYEWLCAACGKDGVGHFWGHDCVDGEAHRRNR